MRRASRVKEIVEAHGRLYSESLGINLKGTSEGELFKWFLASLLFGKRISEEIAARTYKIFDASGVTTPNKILATGWDGLVELLDKGGYVRYDFSTATKLLEVVKELNERYGGSLNALHSQAKDAKDLEDKFQAFYGIGPVTTNIFLRELRGIWPKAAPEPLPHIKAKARELGIRLEKLDKRTQSFARLEVALHRLSRLSRSSRLSRLSRLSCVKRKTVYKK